MPKLTIGKTGCVIGILLIVIFTFVLTFPDDVGARIAECQIETIKQFGKIDANPAGEFLMKCMRSKGYVFEGDDHKSTCWKSTSEPFYIIEGCYRPYSWMIKFKGM